MMRPHPFARPLSVLLVGCGALLFQGDAVVARQSPAPASLGLAPVANASFEETDGKTAAGWKTARFDRARPDFAIDDTGHSGQHSARITARDGADAAWTAIVTVRPYAKYRLSGWIKTEGVRAGTGRGALFNVHGMDGTQTAAVTGTADWTAVDVTFDTGGRDAVQVNCLLGGWGASAGTAWFDDVKLELLSARTLQPQASVDPARRRPAMSKYVYGQFIEHLGRCIYGGIWAEMLEDRKFYYDVGAKESPWKPAGDSVRVLMNPIEVFVGTHSPEVRLRGDGKRGGIAQDGLALLAGRKYTGRVVLAASPDSGPISVTLSWGDGPGDRETVPCTLRQPYTYDSACPFSFTARADTERGRLEITAAGRGAFRIGTVSLMPADNVDGFRADTLQLLRELKAPVYRWPGGNFVSGYNWKDGIGDRDRRPPRKNPAWQGVEHNDVGIGEFMRLCELIGAEPYIAVNSGFGHAESAAEEVEYVNGAATTPFGRVRAAGGHPEPYKCKWWSIGNEMYGNWQLGNMPVADYVRKHNEFADLMKARDPGIQLIGVGAVGAWDEAMLAGARMDLVSEHFYCQESPGLMSHVAQVPNQIRRIAEAHRKYRQTIPSLAGRDLPVAMDEWNYWYGPHVYGELGTRYFLKDALGIAAGFNEYARQSDVVFMANYAQTVNVIGAIKTTKTAAAFDATGVVLKLYRDHFGSMPVELRGAPEPLDVAAAWKEDDSALVLSIVNPTTTVQTLALDFPGTRVPATGRLWRVAGSDPNAYNEPGKPPVIAVQETASVPVGKSLTVPAMSISLLELRVAPPAKKRTEGSR